MQSTRSVEKELFRMEEAVKTYMGRVEAIKTGSMG